MNFRRRGLSVVAVVALTGVVASCSSGSETLRFVPSGGMGNEAASDSKMMWADVSYEVEGTLPEMPSEMVSYEVKKKSAPLNEFEDIAKIFGVSGKAVEDASAVGDVESIFKSYRISTSTTNDNVFEEAMWLYGDGRLWTWSY
jgi:hypothetical protein